MSLNPLPPDFTYRVKQGVAAKAALTEAEQFVDCHNASRRPQLSGLVNTEGETLGFEVRRLYMPFVLTLGDMLRTDYRIKGDKVSVTIRLAVSDEEMRGQRLLGKRKVIPAAFPLPCRHKSGTSGKV